MNGSRGRPSRVPAPDPKPIAEMRTAAPSSARSPNCQRCPLRAGGPSLRRALASMTLNGRHVAARAGPRASERGMTMARSGIPSV